MLTCPTQQLMPAERGGRMKMVDRRVRMITVMLLVWSALYLVTVTFAHT